MAEAELFAVEHEQRPPSTTTTTSPPSPPSAIKSILYGSAAGIVSKLFEHPMDLIKVRLQSQPLDQPARFHGPWDCAVKTLKSEGFLGLWRGVSMPIAGAMAENATLFVVYNRSQSLLNSLSSSSSSSLDPPTSPHSTIPILALSGAIAGSFASFVLTPVELIKCKMQVSRLLDPASPASKLGAIAIGLSVLRRDGMRGLWLGQTGTFVRETGGSGAWFTTFELGVRYFISRREKVGERGRDGGRVTKGDLGALELMASGAAAGVAYNCILFPADCIKSTIQTEDELRGLTTGKAGGEGAGKRRTFMETGREIYRAKGVRGLYSGCGLTALRAAPSSALIFYIYSRLESIFG